MSEQEVVTSTPEEENLTSVSKKENSSISEQTIAAIRKQVEYYLGDYNYPRDKFFLEIAEKNDGWIPLEALVKCKKLAKLSTDYETIIKSLEGSEIVNVDKEGEKLRRNPERTYNPVDKEEETSRTLYFKNFRKDTPPTQESIQEYFETLAPIESVQKRMFHDKNKKLDGFKGSVFVVFKTIEDAKKVYEMKDLKFEKSPIITRWRKDYEEEKQAEWEERQKMKEEKQKKREEHEKMAYEVIAENSFLHISNIPDTASRDDVRTAMSELSSEIAFFGYKKGDLQGYVRVNSGKNAEVLEKLKDKLKIGDTVLEIRLVDGEEEKVQLESAKEARRAPFNINNRKRKQRNGQKSHFRSKRQRVN